MRHSMLFFLISSRGWLLLLLLFSITLLSHTQKDDTRRRRGGRRRWKIRRKKVRNRILCVNIARERKINGRRSSEMRYVIIYFMDFIAIIIFISFSHFYFSHTQTFHLVPYMNERSEPFFYYILLWIGAHCFVNVIIIDCCYGWRTWHIILHTITIDINADNKKLDMRTKILIQNFYFQTFSALRSHAPKTHNNIEIWDVFDVYMCMLLQLFKGGALFIHSRRSFIFYFGEWVTWGSNNIKRGIMKIIIWNS
jgi:hypothetical protein